MIDYDIDGSDLNVSIDPNEDGQPVVEMKLSLMEAVQEALCGGESISGNSVVRFDSECSKIIVEIDSNKDGEPMLTLKIDLFEAFDEIAEAVRKKYA